MQYMRRPCVLFVDDHEVLARLSCEILEMQGYRALSAYDGFTALKIFREERPDIIVTDYRMDEMSGIDLAHHIWGIDRHVPIIIVTGYGSIPLVPNRRMWILRKEDLFPSLLERLESLIPPGTILNGEPVLETLVPGVSNQLPVSPEIIVVGSGFIKLLDDVLRDPSQLRRLMPSREFEELIAWLWNKLGYEVELTARTRDGGRDIIAIRKAETYDRVLIECKRYAPENKVGVGLVRSLYGVLESEKATKAVLTTTSTFTEDAKIFLEHNKWRLEGHDFDRIVDWLRKFKAGPTQKI
jgi:CheY-like chemotaxis protein